MKSINHQFIELSDRVVKRYVRTTMYPIGGRRPNPRSTTYEIVDFLLATPENNYTYTPFTENEPTKVEQKTFTYEEEVLELYSLEEDKAFRRLNPELFREGTIVEYTEGAPIVNSQNSLSDVEIKKIANLKTKTAFQNRLANIDSRHTLNLLLKALEDADAPMSFAKMIRERINELD